MRKLFPALLTYSLVIYAQAAPIKVACIGDSITQGVGATDQATRSYPAVLQTLLGPEYEVRNFGSGGATLLDVEPERSYMKRPVFEQSLAFEANILLITLGTNDSNTNDRPTFEALDDFTNGYDRLIARYMEGRKKPPKVFIGVTPWMATKDAQVYGLPYGGGWGFTQTVIDERMAPMIRAYAKSRKYTVVDLHRFMMNRSDWFSTDPVHPGDAGYKQIAICFARHLLPTVTIPDDEVVATRKPEGGEARFQPAGWTRRAGIKVTGYQGDDLADFPVLVSVSPSTIKRFSYSQCLPDGADLRFSDSQEGGHELFYEVERWDSTGTSLIWVRLPNFKKGGVFYMWWGNAKADPHEAAFSEATWNSGHLAVWHMNEPARDSSGNCRSLTVSKGKGTRPTNGIVAVGQYFDAETQLSCADPGLTGLEDATVIAWARSEEGRGYGDWGASVWGLSGYPGGVDVTPAGNFRFNWQGEITVESDATALDGAFHCLVQTVTRPGGPATGYDDGWMTFPVRICPEATIGGELTLGHTGYHEKWQGTLDEVRILNHAITPDYARALHDMVGAGTPFLTYGPAQKVSSL